MHDDTRQTNNWRHLKNICAFLNVEVLAPTLLAHLKALMLVTYRDTPSRTGPTPLPFSFLR